MTHDRADRNTQICATKAYADEFCNMNARLEAHEENNNPQVFVLGSDAQTKNIEGSFVSKKKSNKGRGSLQKY